MLLWQVAARSAHQEGLPSVAGGDVVLRPLWEEDEAVSRSHQGNGSTGSFQRTLASIVCACVAAGHRRGRALTSHCPSSQYLSRNVVHSVRREHFSFSPRMPVGDFFEERDTPEVPAHGFGVFRSPGSSEGLVACTDCPLVTQGSLFL